MSENRVDKIILTLYYSFPDKCGVLLAFNVYTNTVTQIHTLNNYSWTEFMDNVAKVHSGNPFYQIALEQNQMSTLMDADMRSRGLPVVRYLITKPSMKTRSAFEDLIRSGNIHIPKEFLWEDEWNLALFAWIVSQEIKEGGKSE